MIGNGSYLDAPLSNPPNDAQDIAGTLKKLNFSATLLIDANQIQMRKAIRKFGRELKKGGVGLFYYAGHGMQVNGTNPNGTKYIGEASIQKEGELYTVRWNIVNQIIHRRRKVIRHNTLY